MVWKDSPRIEKEIKEEPKIDLSLFKKKGNSKTFKGYLISCMRKARDNSNPELVAIIQHFYKKYLELESFPIPLSGWKGKSGIKIIERPDLFIVETYQRKDQDSTPEPIRREISKAEVNRIINSINNLDEGGYLPTREIGQHAYGKPWNDIFSDRWLHTQLNLILRLLDAYNVIHYRGGKSKVLKKVISIQMK